MKPSRKKIARTFFQGAAAVLPVVLTVWVVIWLGNALEGLLQPLFMLALPDGWYFPGLAIVFGVLLIYGAGVLVNTFLGRLVDYGGAVLDRIPGIKTVYGGLKDLFHFLAGSGKQELEGVVRVEVADGIHLVGFLTGKVTEPMAPAEDTLAIYLPMSYQIGGFTALVPKDRVTSIDMSVEDAMRKTLTAWINREEPPPAPLFPDLGLGGKKQDETPETGSTGAAPPKDAKVPDGADPT